MKYRLISVALLSAVSCGAYAASNTDLGQLKSEIAALKTQVQSIENKQNSAQSKQSAQVTTANIGKYLFWDNVLNSPLGMSSSTREPLAYLKHRSELPDQGIAIGGYLEFDAQTWWGDRIDTDQGTYKSGKAIGLGGADLYVLSNLGHYVQTGLVLDGVDVNVLDAFVTFGNLSEYPVYLTIGKHRLPAGVFANGGGWIGGLQHDLFRPGHIASANLGYDKDGLNLNASFFQTDNQTSDFLTSAYYSGNAGKVSFGGDVSYLYNILGSGAGVTSAAAATGNKDTNGAVTVEGNVGYDIYGLNAGISNTTKKQDYSNNSYLGAWYVQGSVSPIIAGKGTQFSLGYQQTYNAQNASIGLAGDMNNGPSVTGVRSEIVTYVSRPVLFKNNIVTLEYAYLNTYSNKHTNEITLDISTYF
ncbi:DUF3573 domain-containing protein [Cysteiniphilum sp. 6C5]|uniref:DUF3573 domain-containing protein n=1 Tax=unclassified Cysteiniphilum TaxID=2610889 RepID=UPI003F82C436